MKYYYTNLDSNPDTCGPYKDEEENPGAYREFCLGVGKVYENI